MAMENRIIVLVALFSLSCSEEDKIDNNQDIAQKDTNEQDTIGQDTSGPRCKYSYECTCEYPKDSSYCCSPNYVLFKCNLDSWQGSNMPCDEPSFTQYEQFLCPWDPNYK